MRWCLRLLPCVFGLFPSCEVTWLLLPYFALMLLPASSCLATCTCLVSQCALYCTIRLLPHPAPLEYRDSFIPLSLLSSPFFSFLTRPYVQSHDCAPVYSVPHRYIERRVLREPGFHSSLKTVEALPFEGTARAPAASAKGWAPRRDKWNHRRLSVKAASLLASDWSCSPSPLLSSTRTFDCPVCSFIHYPSCHHCYIAASSSCPPVSPSHSLLLSFAPFCRLP